MPVKNASPLKVAVSQLEQRATQGAKEKVGMAGHNDGGYEKRVTQEV